MFWAANFYFSVQDFGPHCFNIFFYVLQVILPHIYQFCIYGNAGLSILILFLVCESTVSVLKHFKCYGQPISIFQFKILDRTVLIYFLMCCKSFWPTYTNFVYMEITGMSIFMLFLVCQSTVSVLKHFKCSGQPISIFQFKILDRTL